MAPGAARARASLHSGSVPHDAGNVLIVEEYVPEYRRRFFEMLETALARDSIRLTVAVGSAPGALAARRDAATEAPFVRVVPARTISIAGRRLTLKRVSRLAAAADLVVVDQALRHLENYPLLVRQGTKIALWGHGARRAKRASHLERSLERRIARAAHWFFAYTPGSADLVAAGGFPRERITVVQNTFDVRELVELRKSISVDDQLRLLEDLELPPRGVCLYIGALDRSKRLDFLLEACSIVASQVPGFALVIAGDGPERSLLETARASRPWLRYVGRATGWEKARLGAVSDLILAPGSVGLVAVDSFALETPIVTTRWPYHGPEMDYLVDGANARIAGDSVVEFADAVVQLLLERDELDRLKAGCAAAAPRYSLEAMVENFAAGIRAALAMPRR